MGTLGRLVRQIDSCRCRSGILRDYEVKNEEFFVAAALSSGCRFCHLYVRYSSRYCPTLLPLCAVKVHLATTDIVHDTDPRTRSSYDLALQSEDIFVIPGTHEFEV